MWDRWRLDWEAGLRQLPFFIQRLAVVLAGLVVAVLALIGGLAVVTRPLLGAPPPAPVIQGGQPPAARPPATGPSHSPTPGQPRAATPGAASSAPQTTTQGGRGPTAPPAISPPTSTTTPSTSAGPIGELVDRLLPPVTS